MTIELKPKTKRNAALRDAHITHQMVSDTLGGFPCRSYITKVIDDETENMDDAQVERVIRKICEMLSANSEGQLPQSFYYDFLWG